jgi:hypothetical protein
MRFVRRGSEQERLTKPAMGAEYHLANEIRSNMLSKMLMTAGEYMNKILVF